MAGSYIVNVPKLKGRENYDDWAYAARNFLLLEGIDIDALPEKMDAKEDRQAKAKLVMTIDPSLYVHIKTENQLGGMWNKLKKLFDDSGFTRKISLLRTLISIRLENSESMTSYITQIVETAQRLRGMGFQINEEWIGSLLLAGLPEKIAPMLMAIEHFGIPINADVIKTKLLDMSCDVGSTETESAFRSKTNSHYRGKGGNTARKHGGGQSRQSSLPSPVKKVIKCYRCKQLGHYKYQCPEGKEKQVNAFSAAFLKGNFSSEDWYIDSGASAHMTANRDSLSSVRQIHEMKEIIVANKMSVPVLCAGDTQITTVVNGCKFDIQVKNVLCITSLTTNLLSVSQLMAGGNRVTFNMNACYIHNQYNQLIGIAVLENGVYKLIVEKPQCVLAAAVETQTSSVWHRRLGNINSNDLQKMKNGAVEGVTYTVNVPAVSFGLALGWVSLVSGDEGGAGDWRVVAAAGGTFLAGLVGVPLSARALALGRRTALFLTSLAFVACWSLKLVGGGGGGGGWCVVVARLAAGLGGAAAWCISPLMAKEMCSESVRGAAVSALVLAHNLGLLLMYVGADLRVPQPKVLWCCLSLSLVHCGVTLFVPESPSFLAARGRHKEARLSLAWLRGLRTDNAALDEELASLPPLENPLESSYTLVKDMLSDMARRRAFVISLAAVVAQEACGVLALLQFAERVFMLTREGGGAGEPRTSGGELASPARYALWLGVVQFAASAVALYLVERVGRKPLLVTTAFLVSVCMCVCAGWVWSGRGGALAGVMLAAAVAADSAGLQPVPYAMLTEMFHYQYRSCVHMIVMAAACVGNALEVLLFPGIVALGGGGAAGVAAALALCAAFTLLYAVLALVYLPETRGKTVEQIYDELCPGRPRDGTSGKCAAATIEGGRETSGDVCSKETVVTSM